MDSLKLVNNMAEVSSLVAKQNRDLKQELAKLKEENEELNQLILMKIDIAGDKLQEAINESKKKISDALLAVRRVHDYCLYEIEDERQDILDDLKIVRKALERKYE